MRLATRISPSHVVVEVVVEERGVHEQGAEDLHWHRHFFLYVHLQEALVAVG
jgi:hypothetical protein